MNPDTGIWMLCQDFLKRHQESVSQFYEGADKTKDPNRCACDGCKLAGDILTELVVRRTKE